jgi:hypothetical protein
MKIAKNLNLFALGEPQFIEIFRLYYIILATNMD